MKPGTHLKMWCCSRYLAVLLIIPAVAFAATPDRWTGTWFPENPMLRASTQMPHADEETAEPVGLVDEFIEHWTGKWFPGNPNNESTTPLATAEEIVTPKPQLPVEPGVEEIVLEPVKPIVEEKMSPTPIVEIIPVVELSTAEPPSSSSIAVPPSSSSTAEPPSSSSTAEPVVAVEEVIQEHIPELEPVEHHEPIAHLEPPVENPEPVKHPEHEKAPELAQITERPLPASTTVHLSDENIEHWTGKWSIDNNRTTTPMPLIERHENETMQPPSTDCDNAKDHLYLDFDPANINQSLVYVCLADRSQFMPNTSIAPLLKVYEIPPAYRPLHHCMDVEITYETRIPTFGDHRPLWPKYGQYKYVPPQRWLHNVEHGAIVMLYHPCANFNQVEKLKMLVKSCIYRHIITPTSELLEPERPLALVAWGKSLEMSVIDEDIVIKFIQDNALRAPEINSNNGQYEKLLLQHADIVSNIDDSILCPNIADPLQKYLQRRQSVLII